MVLPIIFVFESDFSWMEADEFFWGFAAIASLSE
jgi:hypothetical protein